jgi:hypothetical protein
VSFVSFVVKFCPAGAAGRPNAAFDHQGHKDYEDEGWPRASARGLTARRAVTLWLE